MIDRIVIVVRKTRLEELIVRFNTKSQAKFYIEQEGLDFTDYLVEYDTYKRSLEEVRSMIPSDFKVQVLDRSLLPTVTFLDTDLIIVVGQDGLVANTAKYVKGRPIIGINPDVKRFDGVLLPFLPQETLHSINMIIKNKARKKFVTLAKATLDDGQELIGFNDLFIGAASHSSARYNLEFHGKKEAQSSSGIIISTGIGATGWLSSIFNMNNQINSFLGIRKKKRDLESFNPEEEKLLFVVREPFLSKYSGIKLSVGAISKGDDLKLESLMPSDGVIFSDGLQTDYLNFNSGNIASIGIAPEKACLVHS